MKPIPIGRLSEMTGVKVPTIRYYESIGLLPEPDRTGTNRRLYGDDAVWRVRFIRHARELGFDIEAIRELIALAERSDGPCDGADRIAQVHMTAVEARIAQLQALREELRGMLNGRHQGISDCRVIQVLGDHANCSGPHRDPDKKPR